MLTNNINHLGIWPKLNSNSAGEVWEMVFAFLTDVDKSHVANPRTRFVEQGDIPWYKLDRIKSEHLQTTKRLISIMCSLHFSWYLLKALNT